MHRSQPLFGAPGYSYARPSSRSKARPVLATGYSVNLDVSAHVSHSDDAIGGFNDALGLVYGTERIRFWNVGGHAKLFWTLPCGPLVWTPFVAATIDQEFGYSHTLDIPVQTAAVADVFYYGSVQTFLGAQAGIEGRNPYGVRFGLNGYYRQSSEFQVLGGQAYLKFPILHWLGVQ